VKHTNGYRTAVTGRNDFLCLVERSWGASTDDPQFWNPKVRSPICFNPLVRRHTGSGGHPSVSDLQVRGSRSVIRHHQ
jgi:hypothetical protein